MSNHITFFSVVIAYVLTCLTKGAGLISPYALFNEKELILTFLVAFLISAIVLYSFAQYARQKKYIKAARTMRRVPKLREHLIAGVVPGSFAYLSKQTAYGTEGDWLPAMSVVFVVCSMDEISNGPAREASYLVVPYFTDEGLEKPSIAVEVPACDLLKHVPRHLIPEII